MSRCGSDVRGACRMTLAALRSTITRACVTVIFAGLWLACRTPPPLAPLPSMGTCSAPLDGVPLGAWSAGPSAQKRRVQGLMLGLSGGRVLFAGGRSGGPDAPCGTDVEVFEPATMAWRTLAPLPISMCGGVGVELADGRMLVGIHLPGPEGSRGKESAVLVMFDPTNNRWTDVGHVAAKFELYRIVSVRDDEALILGSDANHRLQAYMWSTTGLVRAAVPRSTNYYSVVAATVARDRTVTWFLQDSSVMRSSSPDAVAAPLTAARSRTNVDFAVTMPNGQVIAASTQGWLLWNSAGTAWSDITSPPRYEQGRGLRAMMLHDERILVARPGPWESSASLYTPSTDEWTRIASPQDVDNVFAALPDGRILAVDETGRSTIWSADATMDLSWRRLASIPVPLYGASVTSLADGRLLVVGGTAGDDLSSQRAIVVDPVTGAWTETGSMSTPRTRHTATLLPDGRVVVAGGSDLSRIVDTITYLRSTEEPDPSDYDEGIIDLDTIEVWDPTTGAWTDGGRLSVPLTEHAAIALADGRVAFVGGKARRRIPKSRAGGVWELVTGTWKFGGVMMWEPATKRVIDVRGTTRRDSVGVVALRDGRVLVLGGAGEGEEPTPLDLIQVLDPRTDTLSTVDRMRVSRLSPIAAELADGAVFIAGGSPVIDGTLRRPGLPPEVWRPGSGATPIQDFDRMRLPQAIQVLPSGVVAASACDRTVLWDPATSTWSRTDDLPPGSQGCRIFTHAQSLLAITPEGCVYELGAATR